MRKIEFIKMVMTQLKNKLNKSKEILESRKGSTRDNIWNIYKSKILLLSWQRYGCQVSPGVLGVTARMSLPFTTISLACQLLKIKFKVPGGQSAAPASEHKLQTKIKWISKTPFLPLAIDGRLYTAATHGRKFMPRRNSATQPCLRCKRCW